MLVSGLELLSKLKMENRLDKKSNLLMMYRTRPKLVSWGLYLRRTLKISTQPMPITPTQMITDNLIESLRFDSKGISGSKKRYYWMKYQAERSTMVDDLKSVPMINYMRQSVTHLIQIWHKI